MANEYKLSYTAADINKKLGQIESLASKDEVPTKLSDLVDDKGYLTTADVENQYALRPPALVSFIDDDCRIETYNVLFPVILDLNIPYAIACPPGNIGVTDGYMLLDDFANMANNENITVTCHHKTQTNMNTYASIEDYAADLDECIAWYESVGISNVKTVCYPQGVYVDEYMQAVRDRFVMGFTTDRGINQMPQESYYMRRCELFPTNGKYTFDDAKALVSEVATNGGWLIFMTHAWYPTFDAAKLTELVQYIQGIGNVEIVGIDDAISKIGNKVEIGNFHKPIADLPNPYFVIDAVGNTYTNGYKTADLSLRTKKVISTTGPVVTTSDIEYVVSDKFDITGQTSVIVSGWASDGYGLYVFYDDAGNRKKVAYSTKAWNEGRDLLKDVEIQVPEGATKIAIAGYFRQQTPCLKVATTLTGKWAGKVWAAVGDSLTEKNIRTSKSYHDYISEETGISVVNMGVGGTGYKNGYSKENAFYQRVSTVSTDVDVVTIFGSFNDLSTTLAAEIGNPTDTGTDTLCGCINTTIDNLYAAFPLARLGVITPTPWVYNRPDNTESKAGQYVDAISSICRLRGIPYLDLFRCSGLRPWEESFRNLAYSKDGGDGTHPDETGHALIAPRIKAFLETLLM